eukprot:gene30142-27127_t
MCRATRSCDRPRCIGGARTYRAQLSPPNPFAVPVPATAAAATAPPTAERAAPAVCKTCLVGCATGAAAATGG